MFSWDAPDTCYCNISEKMEININDDRCFRYIKQYKTSFVTFQCLEDVKFVKCPLTMHLSRFLNSIAPETLSKFQSDM